MSVAQNYKVLLWTGVATLLTAVGFTIVLFLMKANATGPQPLIYSIFFIALVGVCILGSIALDVGFFELKRNQSPENEKLKKPAYHPNLRIWALGMIAGISTVVIYLISVVTLSLVGVTAITNQVLYQYGLLLFVLTVAIAFTIWGIVQVSRGE